MATYPSGKGEVCKTFIQRFESARRLHFPSKEKLKTEIAVLKTKTK